MHFSIKSIVMAVAMFTGAIEATFSEPKSKESWNAGQSHQIQWDKGSLKSPLKLYLGPGDAKDASVIIVDIAVDIQNTGSYSWSPSTSIAALESFTIILVDAEETIVVSEAFIITALVSSSGSDSKSDSYYGSGSNSYSSGSNYGSGSNSYSSGSSYGSSSYNGKGSSSYQSGSSGSYNDKGSSGYQSGSSSYNDKGSSGYDNKGSSGSDKGSSSYSGSSGSSDYNNHNDTKGGSEYTSSYYNKYETTTTSTYESSQTDSSYYNDNNYYNQEGNSQYTKTYSSNVYYSQPPSYESQGYYVSTEEVAAQTYVETYSTPTYESYETPPANQLVGTGSYQQGASETNVAVAPPYQLSNSSSSSSGSNSNGNGNINVGVSGSAAQTGSSSGTTLFTGAASNVRVWGSYGAVAAGLAALVAVFM